MSMWNWCRGTCGSGGVTCPALPSGVSSATPPVCCYFFTANLSANREICCYLFTSVVQPPRISATISPLKIQPVAQICCNSFSESTTVVQSICFLLAALAITGSPQVILLICSLFTKYIYLHIPNWERPITLYMPYRYSTNEIWHNFFI